MAITFVNSGTLHNATGNSSTGLPANVQDGDFLLLRAVSYDTAYSHTCTTGWTEVLAQTTSGTTRCSLWFAWYKASSPNSALGQVNAAPTITRSTSTAYSTSQIHAWRGVVWSVPGAANPSFQVGAWTSSTTTAASTLSTATTEITTTDPNELVVHCVFSGSSTNGTMVFSSPTGAATGTTSPTLSQTGGATTTRLGLGISTLIDTSAGATGTANLTISRATNSRAVLMGLIPAPTLVEAQTASAETLDSENTLKASLTEALATPSDSYALPQPPPAIASQGLLTTVDSTHLHAVSVDVPANAGVVVVSLGYYSPGVPTATGMSFFTQESRYAQDGYGSAAIYTARNDGTPRTVTIDQAWTTGAEYSYFFVFTDADTIGFDSDGGMGAYSSLATINGTDHTLTLTTQSRSNSVLLFGSNQTGSVTTVGSFDSSTYELLPDAGGGGTNTTAFFGTSGGTRVDPSTSKTIGCTWGGIRTGTSVLISVPAIPSGIYQNNVWTNKTESTTEQTLGVAINATAGNLLLALVTDASYVATGDAITGCSGSSSGAFASRIDYTAAPTMVGARAFTVVAAGGAETITASWNSSCNTQIKQITVVELSGFDSSTPVGSIDTGDSATSIGNNTTLTLTRAPDAAGSFIYTAVSGITDYQAGAPVAAANTTMVASVSQDSNRVATFRLTDPTPDTSSVAVGNTNTNFTTWAGIWIEIKAAPAAEESNPYSRTISESATASDSLASSRKLALVVAAAESETPSDSLNSSRKLVLAVTAAESVTAGDAKVSGNKLPVSPLAETQAATEALDAKAVVPGAITEAQTSAADVLASGATISLSFSEAVTPGDAVDGAPPPIGPTLDTTAHPTDAPLTGTVLTPGTSGSPGPVWQLADVSTPTFSTAGATTIFAVVLGSQRGSAATEVFPVTMGGTGGASGLIWTLVQGEVFAGTYPNLGGAVVYKATSGSALSGVTVKATPSNQGSAGWGTSGWEACLAVYCYQGTVVAGDTGGSWQDSDTVSGALTASVTPTATGSQVIGGFTDQNTKGGLTANSSTSAWELSATTTDSTGGSNSFGVGRYRSGGAVATTTVGEDVTLGSSSPSTDLYVASVVVEVKASAGPESSITETETPADALASQLVAPGVVAETVTPADEALAAKAAVTGTLAETSTASDSLASTLLTKGSFSESVTPTETVAAASAATPSIRSGFPVVANHNSASVPYTVTTASFSANAGEKLIAFASTNEYLPRLTSSPGTLHWVQRAVVRNDPQRNAYPETGLFEAVVPVGGWTGTVSMTVPDASRGSGYNDYHGNATGAATAQIQIFAFDNWSNIGAIAWRGSVNGENNDAKLTIKAFGTNSLVLSGGGIWGLADGSVAATTGSALVGSSSNSMAVFSTTTSAPGDIVVGSSASQADWCLIAVEIMSASATPPAKFILCGNDSGTEGSDSTVPWPVALQNMWGGEYGIYGHGVWWDYSGDALVRFDAEKDYLPTFEWAVAHIGKNDIDYEGALETTNISALWTSMVSKLSNASNLICHPYAGSDISDAVLDAVGATNIKNARTYVLANAPTTHFINWNAFYTYDGGGNVTGTIPAYSAPDGQHFNALGEAVLAQQFRDFMLAVGLGEATTPSDADASANKSPSTLAESQTSSEAVANAARTASSLTETATPSDTAASSVRIAAAFAESQVPSDSASSSNRTAATLAESQTSVDQLAESVSPAGGESNPYQRSLAETASPEAAFGAERQLVILIDFPPDDWRYQEDLAGDLIPFTVTGVTNSAADLVTLVEELHAAELGFVNCSAEPLEGLHAGMFSFSIQVTSWNMWGLIERVVTGDTTQSNLAATTAFSESANPADSWSGVMLECTLVESVTPVESLVSQKTTLAQLTESVTATMTQDGVKASTGGPATYYSAGNQNGTDGYTDTLYIPTAATVNGDLILVYVVGAIDIPTGFSTLFSNGGHVVAYKTAVNNEAGNNYVVHCEDLGNGEYAAAFGRAFALHQADTSSPLDISDATFASGTGSSVTGTGLQGLAAGDFFGMLVYAANNARNVNSASGGVDHYVAGSATNPAIALVYKENVSGNQSAPVAGLTGSCSHVHWTFSIKGT